MTYIPSYSIFVSDKTNKIPQPPTFKRPVILGNFVASSTPKITWEPIKETIFEWGMRCHKSPDEVDSKAKSNKSAKQIVLKLKSLTKRP